MLTRRIEDKTEPFLSRSQFGFRKGVGTRDAIGVMRLIGERSIENGKDVFVCFVDFEKAFDRVNWSKMMKVLRDIKVDWKDRRLISDLYLRQEAVVRLREGDTDAATIEPGV